MKEIKDRLASMPVTAPILVGRVSEYSGDIQFRAKNPINYVSGNTSSDDPLTALVENIWTEQYNYHEGRFETAVEYSFRNAKRHIHETILSFIGNNCNAKNHKQTAMWKFYYNDRISNAFSRDTFDDALYGMYKYIKGIKDDAQIKNAMLILEKLKDRFEVK